MITISMLFFFLKQNTWTPQLSFKLTQTSHLENSTYVCGKVSNSHEKEEQEQEWWRAQRPRLI
jgi:hypothetical protein